MLKVSHLSSCQQNHLGMFFLFFFLNLVYLPDTILRTNACADTGEKEQPKGWAKLSSTPLAYRAWKTMAWHS